MINIKLNVLSTKRTSSPSHRYVTYSRHDMAEHCSPGFKHQTVTDCNMPIQQMRS
jgi:hypothetical protein